MIRKLRKYNKWFMAGFGVLLMLTWRNGPITSTAAKIGNRRIGKLDGQTLRESDAQDAAKELNAMVSFAPTLVQFLNLGSDRDSTHWMLLSREAVEGGFVGDVGDGEKFLDDVAKGLAQQALMQDI